VYNGRYAAQVEATNASVAGTGRMIVKVVPPDIVISNIGTSKYGTYVEISNPNAYDLDLSQWRLSIDGTPFPFPKNTLVLAGDTTRFSGLAMGFASTTVSTSTVVKILFPNLEEVTQYTPRPDEKLSVSTSTNHVAVLKKQNTSKPTQKTVLGVSTSTKLSLVSNPPQRAQSKDTRIVNWFRKLFGGQ
jgi:hypothetical protein